MQFRCSRCCSRAGSSFSWEEVTRSKVKRHVIFHVVRPTRGLVYLLSIWHSCKCAREEKNEIPTLRIDKLLYRANFKCLFFQFYCLLIILKEHFLFNFIYSFERLVYSFGRFVYSFGGFVYSFGGFVYSFEGFVFSLKRFVYSFERTLLFY